jgi:hypothetical protein
LVEEPYVIFTLRRALVLGRGTGKRRAVRGRGGGVRMNGKRKGKWMERRRRRRRRRRKKGKKNLRAASQWSA